MGLLIGSFFITSVSGLTVYLGDTVELSGGSTADYVYLFITGPNLPSNGVSPDDISSAVETGDPSSFTRVSVSNNHWKYKWDTSSAGGTLDYGNYLLYAVNSPSGRNDLSGKEYSYTQITVANPSVSASISGTAINTKYTETPAPDFLDTETPEITPNETISPAEQINSPVITSTPSQTKESGGFFGVVILSIFLSSLLLLRTGKR